MGDQLGLDFTNNPPRTQVRDQGKGRAISQVALASLDLPRLEGLVLEAIEAHPLSGASMDELGEWLRKRHRDASAWTCATLSGRLNGLAKRGLAFRRGTRPGRSGRPQGVWFGRPR
jgi:hypothetical protein